MNHEDTHTDAKSKVLEESVGHVSSLHRHQKANKVLHLTILTRYKDDKLAKCRKKTIIHH